MFTEAIVNSTKILSYNGCKVEEKECTAKLEEDKECFEWEFFVVLLSGSANAMFKMWVKCFKKSICGNDGGLKENNENNK